MSSKVHGEGETEKFSVLLFARNISLTFAVLLGSLWLLAPSAVWKAQFESFGKFVLVFLAIHLANSFVEFIFHRYVLHAPVVPFFRHFYRRHTEHHALTRVRPVHAPEQDQAERRIENKYPIELEEQHDASFFPWYSFAVFALLATPFLALGQWLLPGMPVFLGGYCAIAWSLVLYEILHCLAHLSFEKKWEPLLDDPKHGAFWEMVYEFHLRHHADIRSNESVGGFFGFPLPDVVFGTYKRSGSRYEDGKMGKLSWFESPRPRLPIRWLDALAEKAVQRNRASRSE